MDGSFDICSRPMEMSVPNDDRVSEAENEPRIGSFLTEDSPTIGHFLHEPQSFIAQYGGGLKALEPPRESVIPENVTCAWGLNNLVHT
jgi:hypothetical protein